MKKDEFLLPGVVLALVVIVGVALLAGHRSGTNSQNETASSTASTTASTTSSNSTAGSIGTSSYYPYGQTTLVLNQVAGYKDGLSIRPVAVLEDSRCPEGVQCIQAGTVRISLKSSVKNVSTITTLSIGQSVMLNGDTVTFSSVTPAHGKEFAPEESAYRFMFTVIPGITSTSQPVSTAKHCYVGGCSAQLCTDEPGAISTCEYRAEYGCYKTATCERQATGKCGWTQTPALSACLANPPA